MAIMLSAGVNIQEVDLTTIIPQVSTTAGGFAGFFKWGPVNKPILVDSENTMSKIFQPPGPDTAAFYFSAANMLAYGNNLNIVRANSTGLATATANANATVMIPNEDVYFINNFNGNLNAYGQWFARYPGTLGNSIVVSICPSSQAFASNLTATIGATVTANVGDLFFNASASIAANIAVGDLVRVGLGAQSNGFVSVTGVSGTRVNTSSGVVSANGTTFPLSRQWLYASQFSAAPGTSPYVAQKGGSGDELHMIVLDANGAFTGSTTRNYVLEKYSFLSKASDATNSDSSPNYYPTVLINNSKYILWADHPSTVTQWGKVAQGTVFDGGLMPVTTALAGGNGITTPYNYTGSSVSDPNDPGLIAAYSYFQNADNIDISLIPLGPASINVQQWVIDNIVLSRLDCMAFISPRYIDVVNQMGNEASNIVNNYLPLLNRSSSYVVLDSGWKYQFDKYNNVNRYLPLNADIAGLCVNTDTVADPWFSPAGYNRGTIKNVTKLAWNPGNSTSSPYRDLLYVNGVNPVVSFKGAGTILYGDKTLQSRPSAFDRINVRRLFITLEKAIAISANYSLFEFNDAFTRAAFVSMVNPYLRTIKGRRGIYDFQVVCDETNNTPDVIDADQFVGDIYIKPARSINFITLRFVAVGTGVDFSEVVGTF